jgi:4-coumarate--CoA ligase
MPLKSRWSIDIPEQSLPTWLFGSPNGPLQNPDKHVIIDANRPTTHYLTLSTFRLWSKRVAVGLKKAGLQTGDRVLLFSGNNIFFPVVFMGIQMAGGIFTGANPTYVARELAYQLKDSGAKFLICNDVSLDTGLEAAKINGMSKDRVFIFDDLMLEGTGKARLGVRNWNKLIAPQEEGERFVWQDTKTPKATTASLNYSSGTTGVPKGVEITHYNYIANAEQVMALFRLRPDHDERLETERWLGFLPMYHAYGASFPFPTLPLIFRLILAQAKPSTSPSPPKWASQHTSCRNSTSPTSCNTSKTLRSPV